MTGLPRQLVLLAAFLLGMTAGRAATNDDFENGIALSMSGQLPEAATAFGNAAKPHPSSGTLVDLGLAEWQSGHAGAAILAWEQARWINPYDLRAAANLDFARQVAQVEAPELKWYEAVSTILPPATWMWLTALTLWAILGLMILPGVLRRRRTGWHQWLAALAFGIFLFSLTADFGVTSRSNIGFIVRKNTQLRLTPTSEADSVSTLASGESARRLRTRGNFVFIRTPAASGWVAQDEFQTICPP